MVPFAGFSMPVQYSDLTVSESHKWTREKASLFDVGHMVQHCFSGPSAFILLEKITPTSVTSLKLYHSTLSCLLHPRTGGIVDDAIITRVGQESFYVVTNAACRSKDLAYISSQIAGQGLSIEWKVLDNWGLIALQGPNSADVLKDIIASPQGSPLQHLYFGQAAQISLRLRSGIITQPCLISRGGYTGEDGFEISIPPGDTLDVTEALLESAGAEKLRLAGLGARDSLRLEAGMCLYGHDLNDSTTPVEAGLSWIISKERRLSGGFHGSEVILSQVKLKRDGGTGVARRRVGLIVDGAPAREGAEIVGDRDEVLGNVTSGCPSPTLAKNIAMGYIKNGSHKVGTELNVIVRGKRRAARVVKMPFVPSRYWKQAADITPG